MQNQGLQTLLKLNNFNDSRSITHNSNNVIYGDDFRKSKQATQMTFNNTC